MTENYDQALAAYHQKHPLTLLPIQSFDIFSIGQLEISKFNAIQHHWKVKECFATAVYKQKREIIITNAQSEIVFASEGIVQMNGYQPFEVIGKTPKIFQGEATSLETRKNIKIAIQNQLPFKAVILNYNKDGSTYLCEIEAKPKFNSKGELVNYIAFERIAS
jgi:PAS domain S-box-containing protein